MPQKVLPKAEDAPAFFPKAAVVPEPMTDREAKWAEVRCAFCRGTGKDPFGALSLLSTCGVCGGKGTVRVKEPHVTCSFCGGNGTHGTSRLTCTACMGKGVMHVEEPMQTCPVCHGQGVDPKSELELPCTTCGGAGVVSG